jgi:hypothetical protein
MIYVEWSAATNPVNLDGGQEKTNQEIPGFFKEEITGDY